MHNKKKNVRSMDIKNYGDLHIGGISETEEDYIEVLEDMEMKLLDERDKR